METSFEEDIEDEQPIKRCQTCFKEVDNMQQHITEHPDSMFICKFCGKTFSHKTHYTEHELNHDGKPFSCEVCGKGMSTKSALRRHARLHSRAVDLSTKQEKETRISCKDCGKEFASLQYMAKKHLPIHIPSPCDCGECGKHFEYQSLLAYHNC